ncbi:YFH1 [Blepharisma stoltei]|uniref:ferroxidase n=1 Tax=Blepharisma stoltei TaxID=1481888 RepID=A0AAU9J7H0_9CILI|nr:unnamed protein product [Blepharisma stoltei]
MILIKLARRFCVLNENQYSKVSAAFLDKIAEQCEELECFEDVELSDGVVTLKCKEEKTYIINKQSPNKQIWLSSPISGPKRYDFVNNGWVNATDGHKLIDLLSKELSSIYKQEIKLQD